MEIVKYGSVSLEFSKGLNAFKYHAFSLFSSSFFFSPEIILSYHITSNSQNTKTTTSTILPPHRITFTQTIQLKQAQTSTKAYTTKTTRQWSDTTIPSRIDYTKTLRSPQTQPPPHHVPTTKTPIVISTHPPPKHIAPEPLDSMSSPTPITTSPLFTRCAYVTCTRTLPTSYLVAVEGSGEYLCAQHWADMYDACEAFYQDWFRYGNVDQGTSPEDTPLFRECWDEEMEVEVEEEEERSEGDEVRMVIWSHSGEEVEGWAWDEERYAGDMSADEVYEEGTVLVGQYWW